jgi:hypothetical protein
MSQQHRPYTTASQYKHYQKKKKKITAYESTHSLGLQLNTLL